MAARKWAFKLAHSFLTQCYRSATVRGLWVPTRSFMIFQTVSSGLRSGLRAGWSRRVMGARSMATTHTLALCLGSLSCCTTRRLQRPPFGVRSEGNM